MDYDKCMFFAPRKRHGRSRPASLSFVRRIVDEHGIAIWNSPEIEISEGLM